MEIIKRQIQSLASQYLQFPPSEEDATRMASCKQFLTEANTLILNFHRSGASGKNVAYLHSLVIDTFIQSLTEFALASYELLFGSSWSYPIAIIALGGYGRKELSPFSDVDILFLYPHKINPDLIEQFLEHLCEKILYPLWELKIKVGHSSRTISEAINDAQSKFFTQNAFRESRLVSGSEKLFKTFQEKFSEYLTTLNHTQLLTQRFEELKSRRSKFSLIPFLQEPNIKNGVGGLRDFQSILWLSNVHDHINSIQSLLDHNFITESEFAQLSKAYDFLLCTRNELHFLTQSATETLHLHLQPQIALNLGYQEPNLLKRAELFMKDYYTHTQNIHQITFFIENRILSQSNPKKKKFPFLAFLKKKTNPAQSIDGFILKNNILTAASPNTFIENPLRLLRIYRYSQQYHAQLDTQLIRLIRNSSILVTPELIHQENTANCLRSILQTSGEVYPTLFQMHLNGILNAFLPEFEPLTFLLQHEHYHSYTADIHTLKSIQALDNIFNGTAPLSAQYSKAIHSTTAPSLLYLIILLHDIAKPQKSTTNPIEAKKIAGPILDRLNITEKKRNTVLFTIENHLSMVNFWQRNDLDDPASIARFANFVQDPETLAYLYVFTYCDAISTSKNLWNSYKESLHSKLFRKTLDYFDRNNDYLEKQLQEKKSAYIQLFHNFFPEATQEALSTELAKVPERYFLLCSTAEMALHISLLSEYLKNPYPLDHSTIPTIHWHEDPDKALTTVSIIANDHKGLFSEITGAFSAIGINVLGCKALTRLDKITIDTFYVFPTQDAPSLNPQDLHAKFHYNLSAIILKQKDPLPTILSQAKKSTLLFQQKYLQLQTKPRSFVNIIQDDELRKVIIEIQCPDSLGLLYRISKAISDHNYTILFARIATENGLAMDTLHIEPCASNEKKSPAILPLSESLNKIINAPSFDIGNISTHHYSPNQIS